MCGVRTIEETGTVMGPGGAKFCKLRRKNGLAEYSSRVIVLTTARISKANLQKLKAVVDEIKICGQREINFRDALGWLRAKWNVQRLLCEGGGELHGPLVRAGLVDEIHLTICPKIFGGRTAPTIADGLGFARLVDATKFGLTSTKRVKAELFTVFSKRKSVI